MRLDIFLPFLRKPKKVCPSPSETLFVRAARQILPATWLTDCTTAKACPNNVLQPLGFEQGLEGLWTPAAKPDWAGCESSCNACGQVCPTGAIRALPLEEKRVVRMGLAIVNLQTCLPYAQREACQLCVDDCQAAGYDARERRPLAERVASRAAGRRTSRA